MSRTMWRLSVDRSACLGTGVCAGTASDHFEVDTDGRSRPLMELAPPDEAVLDAALACPMEAIRVLDAETGEVLAPDIS